MFLKSQKCIGFSRVFGKMKNAGLSKKLDSFCQKAFKKNSNIYILTQLAELYPTRYKKRKKMLLEF
jgi:hypothetical protein